MNSFERNVIRFGCLLYCLSVLTLTDATSQSFGQQRLRARALGIDVGILPTGQWNAITDVPGVRVGHQTIERADNVRTGVTVVLPHGQDLFQHKVPGAIYTANGFGKLAGLTQVNELGSIETPIALTNTLSVPACVEALVKYTLEQPGNESVRSVNAVVGETNDGFLNDIRGLHVQQSDVSAALKRASGGPVEEGCVGAGTGTLCLGFKGGIGTASRKLTQRLGGCTVGVLVQTNFGGILTINGAPVGRELNRFTYQRLTTGDQDGSCMIVVATDAALSHRNLMRLARRTVLGMARCGSFMSNGSGDYVIAFSTHQIAARSEQTDLPNQRLNPLFLAAVEATEEAIYNSLLMATTQTGRDGNRVEAISPDRVKQLLENYNLLNLGGRLPAVR